MTHVTQKQIDPDLAKFLHGVTGVVEADSYAYHQLWQSHADNLTARENGPRKSRRYAWERESSGRMVTIGRLDDRPVCVELYIAVVDDQRILFWNCCSQVVDRVMIDAWLAETMPRTAFWRSRLNEADADNFHNVLDARHGLRTVTPLHLEILLWYHCRCEDFRPDSTAFREYAAQLVEQGLLRTPGLPRSHDGSYGAMEYGPTERTHAFVNHLCGGGGIVDSMEVALEVSP